MYSQEFELNAAERLTQTEVDAIQTIPDLADETIAYHLRQARRGLLRTGKKLGDFRGAEVVMTGSQEVNYLCLVKDKVILYLIRTKTARMGGIRYGQQVMLIRNAKPEFASLVQGFAVFAFFKILLPKYHILLSDKEQTLSGAKAYRGLVATGLSKGFFVCLYDRRSTPNKWYPIRSSQDFQAAAPKAWGPGEGDKRILLVLSDSEIKPAKQSVEIVEQ